MNENTSEHSLEPDIKITKDGSHTLFSHRFNQYYHNPNGAVAESKHNFFEVNGLYKALDSQSKLTILEIGFGTGLNLLLLLDALASLHSKMKIRYYTIEAYPVDADTAASFNFGEYISKPELVREVSGIFKQLKKGFNTFEINPQVQVTVFYGLFEDLPLRDLKANFIFHDAFSPEVNEELWTGQTFKRLKALSAPDVILTTYSAASKAKGAMAWAGWKVAKAPGALGKREMTIAALNAEKLKDFDRIDEERLAKRYERGDF